MGLGSAAASALLGPFAVHAQQVERVRRVVALFPRAADDTEGIGRLSAFRQALLQLGWTDGRNMEIDVRWIAPDNPAEARRSAVELAALARTSSWRLAAALLDRCWKPLGSFQSCS